MLAQPLEVAPGRLAAGFELEQEAKSDDDVLSEGGLGIAIIRSIADEVEIDGGPGGKGSRLRFVKLL